MVAMSKGLWAAIGEVEPVIAWMVTKNQTKEQPPDKIHMPSCLHPHHYLIGPLVKYSKIPHM